MRKTGLITLFVAKENDVKAIRLVLLAFLSLVSTALSYTYVQVGVNSNFLIDDGKVYFAQSDGSLTVLNLETGDIVARKKNIDYGGTLHTVDNGILVNSDELTVINKSTLDVIWQEKHVYDPMIDGNRLVSYDGNGLVACRDLMTGKILWSYDLPGALEFVGQKGKLLVFREAVYDGPTGVPAVVLLDMGSGKELLHRTTPPNVHYLGAFFDGEKIYLPSGRYKGEHTPNLTRYDSGRPSARFERMLVWDLDGNELESTPVSGGEMKTPDGSDAFSFSGKVFARNRVWASMDDVSPWREGRGKKVYREEPSDDYTKQVSITSFDCSNANVSITVTANYGSRFDDKLKRSVEVALKSETGNWKGYLPYLKNPGQVVSVELTEKLLLLGTDLGHVEAVDRTTGRSKWMYIFPTIRHTMSCSTYGMPPMMATAAKTYERENKHQKPESGLILAGTDKQSTPKVSFDPEPGNPFRMLPLYLAIAWAAILIPISLSGFVVCLAKRKNWGAQIPAITALILAMVAMATFFFYGSVSITTAFGFRGGIAVPLVAAVVFALRTIEEKHWICGGLVLFLALGLGIFIFPAFLRL